jgi:phage terminase small subunit
MTKKTFEKYKLVIDEWFVNGFNGTKAYQKVYPKSKASTAASNFEKILRITEIENYVKAKKEEAKKALRTTHDGLLEELENWAYSDITEALLLSPKQVKELPSEVRRLITKFKHSQRKVRDNKGKVIETIDTVELHFVDKTKAIDMINRHTGFYEKDNEQKGNIVTETREERERRIEELIRKRNAAD